MTLVTLIVHLDADVSLAGAVKEVAGVMCSNMVPEPVLL